MRLILVRLSALGDVVHALPALELLRAALPDAELTWVSEPLAAPVLVGHPALDRVVVLDRPGLRRASTRARAARALRRGMGSLRALRADAALDLQGLLRSAVVARLCGAGRVLGPAWAPEGARFVYDAGLDAPRPGEAHAVARAVALARLACAALGAPAPPDDVPRARLPRALLSSPDARPRIALLPGAGKPANRPPPELLAAVADLVATARPDVAIDVIGGPGDRPLASALLRACARARPVDHTGALDLAGSARLLAQASVVLGGDTGPLHLARALGRPVVALFNAADPARTGPQGLPGPAPVTVLQGVAPCFPCRARHCQRLDRRRVCLDPLDPDRVAASVLALLVTDTATLSV